MARIRLYKTCPIVILLFNLAYLAVVQASPSELYQQPLLVLDTGGHTGRIDDLSVSKSGNYIATGSDDSTVRLWSAADGSLLKTIRVPVGPEPLGKVYSVLIDPLEEFVAVGGWLRGAGFNDPRKYNQHIYLFDITTGELINKIGDLPNVVFRMDMTDNGRYLVAGLGKSEGIRVFDREKEWGIVFEDTDYGADSYGVNGIDFSSDRKLVTASSDGTVKLYDESFGLVANRRLPTYSLGHIKFSPDGQLIAIGDGGSPRIWVLRAATLATEKVLDGIGTLGMSVATWGSSGEKLYGGGRNQNAGGDRILTVWDLARNYAQTTHAVSDNTILAASPLRMGGVVLAAGNPSITAVGPDGNIKWVQSSVAADFRNQGKSFSVSKDGSIVDFGFEAFGESISRFDVRKLQLLGEIVNDGATSLPIQNSEKLRVSNWYNQIRPTLNGEILSLRAEHEMSRGLAIHPDRSGFALATEYQLAYFESNGEIRWQKDLNSAWAVNITGDGNLVVAAYGDGTVRWFRVSDGQHLLSFWPMGDKKNWVVWSPEGYYAATPSAHSLLRWHVNRGWDDRPDEFLVSDIAGFHAPHAIRIILDELDTARALGVAKIIKDKEAVKLRAGTQVAPGAKLHVVAVGISDYGEGAKHLNLDYANKDARDVVNTLISTQRDGLYSEVKTQFLVDQSATSKNIRFALDALSQNMTSSQSDSDLAIVFFSGHGAVVDGEYYLLPHGVKTDPQILIEETGISANDLRRKLKNIGKYGRVLVILDTCRSGTVTANGEGLLVDADLLRQKIVSNNIVVLTSSSGNQLSFEDDSWKNGALTEAFIEALGSDGDINHNRLISVTELMAYLHRRITTLTNGRQEPGVEARFESDILFAGP